MKVYFNRVMTSWPTWTGTLMEMATAVYGVGILMGLWTLPVEVWQQYVAAGSVVLAGLYKLWTIGNNPTNKIGY